MSLGSTNKPPSDDANQDSKECRPKQNGCSKAGVGPSCSNATNLSNPGATAKRNCLEEAKKRCEEKLKDCIRICQEENSQGEENISSVAGVKGSVNGDDSYAMRCGGGNFLEPTGVSLDIGAFTTKPSSFDIQKPAKGHFENLQDYAGCVADCYNDAISNCSTVQCYCGNFKCDSQGPGTGGGFDPFPNDDEEPEDEYDREEKENKLVSVDFNTDSSYGGPIELIYTKGEVGGNVIWLSDLTSGNFTTLTTTTDKIKRVITTTKKFVTYAFIDISVGLCAGEIDQVVSIQLDGIPIFGPGVSPLTQASFRLFKGSETQKVLAAHAYKQGFGSTPAYRGTAYLNFPGFNLNKFTQFPKFTVEIASSTATGPEFIRSEVLTGTATSKVWTVFPEASRLLIETTGGLTCLNTDTMEEVWTAPISDTIEITQQGRAITYDGTNVGIYEEGFEMQSGSYVARATDIAQSFYFRFIDSVGNAGTYLLSEANDGNAVLEQIEEFTPSFPSDSVGVIALTGFDTSPHAVGLVGDIVYTSFAGAEVEKRSVFLFRQGRGTFDNITVRELRMFGDSLDNLTEDAEWYSHTIPEITFNNSFSLVVLGGFFCKRTLSFILFARDNTTKFIVSWSPVAGVNWVVNPAQIPFASKYACASGEAFEEYYYVGSDGSVYSLNVDTGVIATYTTGWTPCAGKQYYDATREHIIYEDSDGRITRAVLETVEVGVDTLESVYIDVLRRSGINPNTVDLTGLDAIEIKGFRSGSFTFGTQILEALSQVYLVQQTVSPALTFQPKTAASQISVDMAHADRVPSRLIVSRNAENLAVTVNYFSVENNGEAGFQSFALDRGEDARLVPVRSQSYTWAILENDAYMRRLAEIYATMIDEASTTTSFVLPPRYLAFSVGDIAVANITGKVQKVSIGADNSMELSLVRDDIGKYSELVSVDGIPSLSLRVDTTNYPDTLAPPMGVASKAIAPTGEGGAGIIVGAANLLGEFDDTTFIAENSSEIDPTPSGAVTDVTLPLIWGRLITPPVNATSSIFATQVDNSLVIEFYDESFVTRILAKTNRFGEYPDFRTVNVSDYNMLLVGKELIQYGFTEAVVGEPRQLRFINLLRARHDTDTFMTHTANELCIYYETQSAKYVPVDPANVAFSQNLITFSQDGFRRGDVIVPDTLFDPLSPGYVTRHDILPTQYEYARNTVYPSSPHVMLCVRPRIGVQNGFTNSRVDLYNVSPDFPTPLYVLKEPFDLARFNSLRSITTDYTYIIARRDVDDKLVLNEFDYAERAFTQNDRRYGYFPHWDQGTTGYMFFGGAQSPRTGGAAVAWNGLTDWLTVVLVSQNEYGERFHIYDFPPGIDYFTRPTTATSSYQV
jgi:hypothetical protein